MQFTTNPQLFMELPTYFRNQNYNQFFNTSKHKKIEVIQEKLTNLVQSLDLCIVPSPDKNHWTNFFLEIQTILSRHPVIIKMQNTAHWIHHDKTHLTVTNTYLWDQ